MSQCCGACRVYVWGIFTLWKYRPLLRCMQCPSAHFCHLSKRGVFNADNLPAENYSHTTDILLAFVPDLCLTDIERVGIGKVVHKRGSPLGHINSVHMVKDHIHVVLASEHIKESPKHRAYMMLIRNYGRHMAFATDPPYCVVYATEYKNMMILPK